MAGDGNWTAGYVTDITYTHGFYRELTPELLSFVGLTANQRPFETSSSFRYCELGCGQGLSANLLAAANPHGQFYATDFNPSQIAGARRLAAEAGTSNVHFYEKSFAEFADDASLPDNFDVIALHGIYSWVGLQARQDIVDFIRRKLRAGGLVYVSYNALPGWSAAAPMRHLMYLHGKAQGGPTGGRLGPAIQFVQKVIDSNAGYFRSNPALNDRFDRLKGLSHNYLAHEYFNDAWSLFYHSEVAADLAAAKLSFIGSAALLEGVDAINLSPAQQEVLSGISDPVHRETVKDFMFNQQFRRDVFVKGPLPMSKRLASETWLDQRFALTVPRADVPMTVKGFAGEANLQPDIYNPILDRLEDGPKTVRDLVASTLIKDLGWARLCQALTILVGTGHLQPSLPAKDDGRRAKSTRAFNHAVCRRAIDSGELTFLASPVTGGGVALARFPQLFLLAVNEGRKHPADWAQFAWSAIAAQGQRIVKEGKTLESPDDNIAELTAQAQDFADKQLALLKSLQIA